MGSSTVNAMGGCRLNPRGLHLGHYLGCFSHLDSLEFDKYFFVIRDVEWYGITGASAIEAAVLNFVADSIAASPGSTYCLPVRQSVLLRQATNLTLLVGNNLTATQLFNAHAKWRRLKQGDSHGLSSADLRFPIDSFVSYLGLGSKFICMNDDNARFVDAGARLARRLKNRYPGLSFPIPELHSGQVPRVNGHDYEKMALGAKNFLMLNSDKQEVQDFVDRIFQKSHFFQKFPAHMAQYAAEVGEFVMPQQYLPYTYSLVFGGSAFEPFLAARINERRSELLSLAMDFVDRFRARRFAVNEKACFARLAEGEAVASEVVARLESEVVEHAF